MNVAHRILHDPLNKVNADCGGKSAPTDMALARLQRGLPTAVLPFGEAAGEMIRATFWTHSQKRTAQVASAAVGASPDTLERIIAGETTRIDAQLLFRVLGAYQVKFGKPYAFGGGLGIAIVEVKE